MGAVKKNPNLSLDKPLTNRRVNFHLLKVHTEREIVNQDVDQRAKYKHISEQSYGTMTASSIRTLLIR